MGTWCEREYDDVEDDEIRDYRGVQVHTKPPLHLLTGEVVEVGADGSPRLDEHGWPIVVLSAAEAAAAEPVDPDALG